MNISVRFLNGTLIPIEINDDETIDDLKQIIDGKEGIPVAQQRLIFNGKHLVNSKTLNDYDIRENSHLHMVLMLRGGLN